MSLVIHFLQSSKSIYCPPFERGRRKPILGAPISPIHESLPVGVAVWRVSFDFADEENEEEDEDEEDDEMKGVE